MYFFNRILQDVFTLLLIILNCSCGALQSKKKKKIKNSTDEQTKPSRLLTSLTFFHDFETVTHAIVSHLLERTSIGILFWRKQKFLNYQFQIPSRGRGYDPHLQAEVNFSTPPVSDYNPPLNMRRRLSS